MTQRNCDRAIYIGIRANLRRRFVMRQPQVVDRGNNGAVEDVVPKIKFGAWLRRILERSGPVRFWAGSCSKNGAVPPSPPFCKISGIIGLAENSRQDLDVKELRY